MSAVFVLLLIVSLRAAVCTELCRGGGYWYDIQSARCRPCRACGERSLLMEACSEFTDTLCVDLREIGRSMRGDGSLNHDEMDRTKSPLRWHETEGTNSVDVPVANAAVASKVVPDNFPNEWEHVIMIVICVSFFFVFGSGIILIVRVTGRRRYENRKNVARARLFSRDRLNTTEYMNNLATLDRRLAMDEILEKRKKAIFEPHLLQENVYTDEVFVDISGLPRYLQDDHEYEELDHSRCLLRMQDQQ